MPGKVLTEQRVTQVLGDVRDDITPLDMTWLCHYMVVRITYLHLLHLCIHTNTIPGTSQDWKVSKLYTPRLVVCHSRACAWPRTHMSDTVINTHKSTGSIFGQRLFGLPLIQALLVGFCRNAGSQLRPPLTWDTNVDTKSPLIFFFFYAAVWMLVSKGWGHFFGFTEFLKSQIIWRGYSAHLEAAIAISMLLLWSFGTLLLKSLSQRAAIISNMVSLPQVLQKEQSHLFLDHGFLHTRSSVLFKTCRNISAV